VCRYIVFVWEYCVAYVHYNCMGILYLSGCIVLVRVYCNWVGILQLCRYICISAGTLYSVGALPVRVLQCVLFRLCTCYCTVCLYWCEAAATGWNPTAVSNNNNDNSTIPLLSKHFGPTITTAELSRSVVTVIRNTLTYGMIDMQSLNGARNGARSYHCVCQMTK
jgi:hypothetical protein